MRVIDENTITDAVLDQIATTDSPRLKEIVTILVKDLHAFTREADLTPEEWLEGIKFLTAVGQKCTPYRQEFVLLSDTLGLSSLINSLHDRRGVEDSTKSSLLGPFYRQDAPVLPLGASIVRDPQCEELCLHGKITDLNGQGIPNALIQVWQPDETGNYDLQKHDPSQMDLRGCFRTDAGGRYFFRTICPLGYMIPMDGPVGDMIRAQGRHGYRPAHIHFLIGAEGYREVVTALYISGDDHIDSDTVFGVTESLIADVKRDGTSPIPGLPGIQYDFQLAPAAAQDASGRVGVDPSQIVTMAALD